AFPTNRIPWLPAEVLPLQPAPARTRAVPNATIAMALFTAGSIVRSPNGRPTTTPPLRSPTMAHRVVLIPGDGTGPELTEATRRVLEATGVDFEWDVREAGADAMEKHGGNPLPPEVLEAVRETGVALKGPITTPVGGGFRS